MKNTRLLESFNSDRSRNIPGGHPDFPFFKKIYEKGMDYESMREISEEERPSEVQANIERVNHKSTEESPEVFQKLLAKDVKHGFSLPINASAVKKIRGVWSNHAVSRINSRWPSREIEYPSPG